MACGHLRAAPICVRPVAMVLRSTTAAIPHASRYGRPFLFPWILACSPCRVDPHEWTFLFHANGWKMKRRSCVLKQVEAAKYIIDISFAFICISFHSVPPNTFCSLLHHVHRFFPHLNSRIDSNRSRWMNLAPLAALVWFFSTPPQKKRVA